MYIPHTNHTSGVYWNSSATYQNVQCAQTNIGGYFTRPFNCNYIWYLNCHIKDTIPLKRIHFFLPTKIDFNFYKLFLVFFILLAQIHLAYFCTCVFVSFELLSYLWTLNLCTFYVCIVCLSLIYSKSVKEKKKKTNPFNQRIRKLIYVLVSFYLSLTRRFNRIDFLYFQK